MPGQFWQSIAQNNLYTTLYIHSHTQLSGLLTFFCSVMHSNTDDPDSLASLPKMLYIQLKCVNFIWVCNEEEACLHVGFADSVLHIKYCRAMLTVRRTVHELFAPGTEFRLKLSVNHSFSVFPWHSRSVSGTLHLTHCHTILPTNWLLGNMAHWMGCIFISLHSELQTLRGKHPYCSLLPSVHSIHKGFALFGTSSNCSSCMYLIKHPWGLKGSHWRQLSKW